MIDIRLLAGVMSAVALVSLLAVYILWKVQDRRDEAFVRELQQRIRERSS